MSTQKLEQTTAQGPAVIFQMLLILKIQMQSDAEYFFFFFPLLFGIHFIKPCVLVGFVYDTLSRHLKSFWNQYIPSQTSVASVNVAENMAKLLIHSLNFSSN